jgi:NTE family protein
VTDADPLSSPALGTSRTDLIEPCRVSEPLPAHPPPPPRQPPIAVAFSGGGFRATLGAVGVLRFLADAGLLGQVRWASSVSGGSVANGLFASAYPEVERAGFTPEAVESHVVRPLLAKVSATALRDRLLRNAWRIVGPRTRTDVLADSLDEWFFAGRLLEHLSPSCRFVFNAANLTTGARFGFERDVFGDYVLGRLETAGSGLRLAEAVAASAALPGALAPVDLGRFTLTRFPPQLCDRLLYRGWWLAGATLSEYHRDLLPDELPFRPDPDA